MDLNDLTNAIAEDLSGKVTANVLAAVAPAIAKALKDNERIGWTEEALAAELGISVETLARKRKAGDIGCSWVIPPTALIGKGKKGEGRPVGGRPYYLRHHVLNYLRRYDTPAANTGKQDVTFENVYQFGLKAA